VRGRLLYPEVPYRAPRWGPLLEPACVALNAAVYAAHLPVLATAQVSLPAPTASGQTLSFSWHRHNYELAIALHSLPPERRPLFLMHDGIASRALTHRSATWMGFDVLVFRRRSPVPPRQQIISVLRATGRDLLMLPDAGGPYGVVKAGLVEIARACGMALQPVSVRSEPAWVVSKRLRHVLPRPFSSIELLRGEPLPSSATVEDCQRALEALDPFEGS
jgi:hypothetical protein